MAIDIFRSRSDIDLVITDIDMPGSMDGIGLAHYLRRHWPVLKLIVVSGKQVTTPTLLPPGTVFFGKPYRHEQIAQAISQMFRWT